MKRIFIIIFTLIACSQVHAQYTPYLVYTLVNGIIGPAPAGAALILKSANGTCYPITIPNAGVTLTVGAAITCPY